MRAALRALRYQMLARPLLVFPALLLLHMRLRGKTVGSMRVIRLHTVRVSNGRRLGVKLCALRVTAGAPRFLRATAFVPMFAVAALTRMNHIVAHLVTRHTLCLFATFHLPVVCRRKYLSLHLQALLLLQSSFLLFLHALLSSSGRLGVVVLYDTRSW